MTKKNLGPDPGYTSRPWSWTWAVIVVIVW